MQRNLLIWNVLLTLVAGYLLVKQLQPAGKAKTGKSSVGDTLKSSGYFKMAYFEMDSVAASFDLVKEVKAELAKKENEINAEIDKLTRNFQDRYSDLQNKAQGGKMNQTEIESASLELKKMDDDIKARKQQLDQEYNDLMVRRQNDIKTKIEAFLKEYNKTKNYSYIISYEQGLFYFRDTAYNITADVVKGLNSKYRSEKKN
ncbi:MAG: OmpH family outer membrane protein [Bacteroidetes bacterium]|nr:OmpH family outer membrane protein [Bacteroidota bacterium]